MPLKLSMLIGKEPFLGLFSLQSLQRKIALLGALLRLGG